MNNKSASLYPCPICAQLMCIVGKDNKNFKIGSCGCKLKFSKTRSQKEMDRKYKVTPWGLEKI